MMKEPRREKEEVNGEGKWSFGVSCMQGWRVSMEDAHLHIPDFDPERGMGLFAVFDGHGGQAVAKIVAKKLPDMLKNHPLYQLGNYRKALCAVFLELDRYLDSAAGRNEVKELEPPSSFDLLFSSLPQDIQDKLRNDEEITVEDFLHRDDVPEEIKSMVQKPDWDDEMDEGCEVDGEVDNPDLVDCGVPPEELVTGSSEVASAPSQVANSAPKRRKPNEKSDESNVSTDKDAALPSEVCYAPKADLAPESCTAECAAKCDAAPAPTSKANFEDCLDEDYSAMFDVDELEDLEDEEDDEEEFSFPTEKSSPDSMGCTANVLLLQSLKAEKGEEASVRGWIANCGDSRSVLCRKGRAFLLSQDHTPALPSEYNRIINAGGAVNKFGRVDGNLNLSRSLGDLFYKNGPGGPEAQKICGVPDIRHVTFRPGDEFIVLGCDGIWERSTNKAGTQQMVNFVRDHVRRGTESLSKIASLTLDRLISSNPAVTNGIGCDNMSMIIVRPTAGTEINDDTSLKTIDNIKHTIQGKRRKNKKTAPRCPSPIAPKRCPLPKLVKKTSKKRLRPTS